MFTRHAKLALIALLSPLACESPPLEEPDLKVAPSYQQASTVPTADTVRLERFCTLLGCIDGASIDFRNREWISGSYKISLKTERAATTCSLTVDPTGKASRSQCEGSLEVESLLPSSILVNEFPRRIEVSVTHNDAIIETKTFTPTYKTTYPNGPDCPGKCLVSEQTLVMNTQLGKQVFD